MEVVPFFDFYPGGDLEDDVVDIEELELQGSWHGKLKSELQSHGLKYGGTLQERVARLFLLKTTPLEMLPKKLLAKK
ncbi:hypothetical protein RHMOL_Rhmol13G0150600 [Rhododendron molle]|uniref:Uncharacterized protein n=1 Tax=Rhododendron molle TaxID=49168 RepID=A0ACC0L7X8_RHOML|nr:hypothetical protein RHMOL_Rhmol13G0150600 [Rhododendron molle]